MKDPDKQSLCSTRQSLLDRVRDPNDKESWTEFVSYYEQYIYNILRTIRIDEPDAKELCQDIIVKLWKKLPELAYNRDKGKFRNWLGVVIRNDANRYFYYRKREQKVMEQTEDEILDNEEDPQSSYDIEKVIIEEWDNYVSNLAWQSVKKRFRKNVQNVFLHHIQGKDNKEIAEICDIEVASVRSYIMRIRNHLKDEIKDINNELL